MKPTSSRRPSVTLSIFTRCALLIAVTVIVVVATVSVQSSGLVKRVASDGVAGKADVVNRFLSVQAAGGIRFGKGDAVAAVLVSATDLSEGMMTGAIAIDLAGAIVASTLVNGQSSGPLEVAARDAIAAGASATSSDGLLRADPVFFGTEQEIIGAVASHWSPQPILAEIARSNRTILAVAAATFSVALAAAILLLRQTISAPLRRVGASMKRVVSGDYDLTIPETGRKDEIGLIARDLEYFRGMMSDASDATKSAVFQSAAFRSSSAAMILADKDFNVALTNAAFDKLARANQDDFRSIHPDFSADDLIGKNIDIFHRNAGRNRSMVTEPGRLPMVTDIRVGARIMALSINGITDQANQIIGYVVEWADVTDIRRDAAVLKALEAKQVRLQFNELGAFTGGNELLGRLAITETTTFSGKHARNLVAPVGTTYDAMEAQLGRGETVIGRFQLTLGANREALLDGAFCPIVDAKGRATGALLLGLDITEQERVLADAERARSEMAVAQERVVDALRTGLARLREGDLTFNLSDPLNPEYEQLREDFNAASRGLHDAIVDVSGMAVVMRNEVLEIVSAADDLSRRTEQQAATLEETAAAVAEITAAVNSASEGARRATEVVKEAKGNAESSGDIVSEAVSAMDAISSSSDQISKIIGVIDDIAFQTNLLALNAGVEAARAGDAGRGFAVVASEVRALAQRSSEAAREISDLITTSGQHVKNGARLVGQAGDALRQIAASVTGISDHVTEIVNSSQEQSTSLTEVNSAMGQLDQVTQQNAAMFEETTAASHALVQQAEGLASGIARFKVAGSSRPAIAVPPRSQTKPKVPVVKPMTPSPAKTTSRRGASTALAREAEVDDDWSDF